MADVHFTIWLISDDPKWPAQPVCQARLDKALISQWMPGALVPGAQPKSVWVVRSRSAGRQVNLRVEATGSPHTNLTVLVVRGDGSVPVNLPFPVPLQRVTLSFTV